MPFVIVEYRRDSAFSHSFGDSLNRGAEVGKHYI